MNFTILKGQMYGNKLYKHQVMIKYMGKKAMQKSSLCYDDVEVPQKLCMQRG